MCVSVFLRLYQLCGSEYKSQTSSPYTYGVSRILQKVVDILQTSSVSDRDLTGKLGWCRKGISYWRRMHKGIRSSHVTSVLSRRWPREVRDTEGVPRGEASGHQSQTTVNRRGQGLSKNHLELKEARRDCLLQASEATWPSQELNFRPGL